MFQLCNFWRQNIGEKMCTENVDEIRVNPSKLCFPIFVVKLKCFFLLFGKNAINNKMIKLSEERENFYKEKKIFRRISSDLD